MNPKLSILIATLERRKHYLERLKLCLDHQFPRDGSVEVLIDCDNGERSTGAKRNNLLQKAKGDYIAYVDCDDLLSPYYVSEILRAIQTRPDTIGINLIMTVNSCNPEHSYHSIQYKTWWDEPDKNNPGKKIYYRNPNHISPVLREHAIKIGFPDQYECEDRVYSAGIQPLLKTEVVISDPIYFYLVRNPKEC